MKHVRWYSSAVLLLVLGVSPVAAVAQVAFTGYPLFTEEAVLPLTVTVDMRALLRDVDDERKEHAATLTYPTASGEEVMLDLKVRTRGHFRRDPKNCDLPPLRFNFKKKQVRETVFEGQNKLKVVVPCQRRWGAYEDFLLKEYLVYKTYNLITDKSFRVRLAEITFVDGEAKRDPFTKYAFFIESDKELAQRLDQRVLEDRVVYQKQVAVDDMALLSVFQYLIGNTDWSVPGNHNVRLLQSDLDEDPFTPKPGIVAVPYDFDWSGFVDARYAEPNPRLGIYSVRERIYRGVCQPEEALQPVFVHLNTQRADIEALYRDFEPLSTKTRKKALGYLNGFYKTINRPKAARRAFVEACRVGV